MNSTTSPPKTRARVAVAVLAAAAVAAASPAIVQAQTDESFGQHVAKCAQTSLGKRANPPAGSCSHEGQGQGQGHDFATFGQMVQVMREHHGGH